MQDIRIGASGTIVKRLQERLVELGYHLSVDGKFGPETLNSVKQFQDGHKLVPDGIVGAKTLAVMFPPKEEVYAPPVRCKIISLSLAKILERANGCIGAPIIYHLEYPNGGTDPDSVMPCDEATGQLDCSGFNAWVQGFDRYQKTFKYWDGYINTDSKIAEAKAEGKWFTVHKDPEVGDMIVGETYRTIWGRRIGHEGTVVSTDHWKDQGYAGISVVHCSPANVARNGSGSSVWKTNGTIWTNAGYKTIMFLRFNREYALSLRA